jgi:hypothetical protein
MPPLYFPGDQLDGRDAAIRDVPDHVLDIVRSVLAHHDMKSERCFVTSVSNHFF